MNFIRNLLACTVLMTGGLSIAFAAGAQGERGARDADNTSHTRHVHNAQGADKVHGAAAESSERAVGSNLPPNIRVLLIQEMLALLDASKQILDALVRGQDDLVARNAQGMHDSFILAQEMTEADNKALHDALPHSFIERDQAFHALTARLSEAARAGDQSRQRELFTEVVNACVACHAAHATDRFPELVAGKR